MAEVREQSWGTRECPPRDAHRGWQLQLLLLIPTSNLGTSPTSSRSKPDLPGLCQAAN